MEVDRRTAMGMAAATSVALSGSALAQGTGGGAPVRHRRIATEEAFVTPELADMMRLIINTDWQNLDQDHDRVVYSDPNDVPHPARLAQLLDMDDVRLQDMNQHQVDVQLLSLTCPGVQIFSPAVANGLASRINDRLAEVIAKNPRRFAGLACLAPQDPQNAVKEMERAANQLKLNGFIINSHTNNEYLDNQKFWPILECAEALGMAIYLHPRAPSDQMADPFRDYTMDSAIWGYGVETGTHAVRMMLGGVFDRFPRLRIVLGHMGEAVHFWLARMDSKVDPAFRASRGRKPLVKELPSTYFKRNFAITTSGICSHEQLRYSIDTIGVENIMWAIDYPYERTAPAVAFMDSAPITEEQRAQIYHQNAERIFKIAPA